MLRMSIEQENQFRFRFLILSFYFGIPTYGLKLAPSLCKAREKTNTPNINFVDVRKNFVDEIGRSSASFEPILSQLLSLISS